MGNIIDCFRSKNREQQDVRYVKSDHPQSKTQKLTQEEETILKLKVAQDKLTLQKRNIIKNSDKAQLEAKQLVSNGERQRAFFALKRKKLYDEYLQQTESQLALIQKTVLEVEAAIVTSDMVKVLKDSNDLLKKLDQSNKLEDIVLDIKERDQNQEKFAEMFKENNIEDDSVDLLFKQFEEEVHGKQIESKEVYKKAKIHQEVQEEVIVVRNESKPMYKMNESSKSQKERVDEDEVNLDEQLMQLA